MPKTKTPLRFSREDFIAKTEDQKHWNIIVVGGGATGLGVALDSASRGYSTLLLEQTDFAKGTSSRSTKLVHGGVRYLAQGDIRLVYSALDERAILLKNATHLVKPQSFIIPCYSQFSRFKYIIGLKLYDWLSGRFSFGSSRSLSKYEVVKMLPNIQQKELVGGVEYFDGQFDDARLAVNLAQTCVEKGGIVLNYYQVVGLLKHAGKVSGVIAKDLESGKTTEFTADVVVNATGVFVDYILRMDEPGKLPLVRPSQGIHLVLPLTFLPGLSALMIPKTPDGRVLFAVPWHNHALVGTTDTPLNKTSLEPKALEQEVQFVLDTLQRYVQKKPGRKDVLSVFAGLRPLAAPQSDTSKTKEISRDHKLIVSESGLVTITGGKWTTYRKMAEETVNLAAQIGKLTMVDCKTKNISVHGSTTQPQNGHFSVFGTDAQKIVQLIEEDKTLGAQLISHLPYTIAEVVWVTRYEMARTVEDVLARRLRILFLDAAAAVAVAAKVARLMAPELGKDEAWQQQQVKDFTSLAAQYILQPEKQND